MHLCLVISHHVKQMSLMVIHTHNSSVFFELHTCIISHHFIQMSPQAYSYAQFAYVLISYSFKSLLITSLQEAHRCQTLIIMTLHFQGKHAGTIISLTSKDAGTTGFQPTLYSQTAYICNPSFHRVLFITSCCYKIFESCTLTWNHNVCSLIKWHHNILNPLCDYIGRCNDDIQWFGNWISAKIQVIFQAGQHDIAIICTISEYSKMLAH